MSHQGCELVNVTESHSASCGKVLVLYAHMLPCTSHVPQTTYTCETSILQSNRA